MAIALAEVRKVCTAAEVALVKLSRPPAVGKLSSAEARRLAVRARKAFDKWQDQKRSQAREKSRETGFGSAAERTALKTEIFRDALASFEKQAAREDASGPAAAKGTPKAKRAAGHRAERAATRDMLSEVKHGKNRRPLPKSKPASADDQSISDEASSEGAAESEGSETATRRTRKKALLTGAVEGPVSNEKHLRQPAQVEARAAAKNSRLMESGVKTRIRGHVSSQVKRAQARRDAKQG